jgi:hypothetical protein
MTSENVMWNIFYAMWNEHINMSPGRDVMHMSEVCEVFARKQAHTLLRYNLRHIFWVHLIQLYDHSLLTLDNIEECINIVDRISFLIFRFSRR